MECAVPLAEDDRQITRLKIDDGHILHVIAIEITCEPKIGSGIRTGILPGLERRVSVAEQRRKTVVFPINHKKIAVLVIIKISKADTQRPLPDRIVFGVAKGSVSIPYPDRHPMRHGPSVGHDEIQLPVFIQIGQRDGRRSISVFVLWAKPKFPGPLSKEHLHFVVTERHNQIGMVISVHILTHERHGHAIHRIMLPFFKFAVPMAEENLYFVASGAGQSHIKMFVVIKVVYRKRSRFLTHMELDLIVKRPIPVPE